MKVAGFGFRAGATPDSLRAAYAQTSGGATALAAPADKCDTPAFRAFAETLNLPVIPVEPDALTAPETLTQSLRVQSKRGTGSVAEAAALAAAGPGARLLGPRTVSPDRMATCAIAEGSET